MQQIPFELTAGSRAVDSLNGDFGHMLIALLMVLVVSGFVLVYANPDKDK